MEYGAKYILWAPFAAENAEPAGKLPTYGTAVGVGSLNKVTENPTFNEAKGYGDNHLVVYLNKFKEAAIGVEVTEIPRKVLSSVSGAEIEQGDHENIWFGDNDKPPYGGMGFYVNMILDDKRDVCMGVFYPKVKAMLQGGEYNTNGENITLSTGKLQFTAASCNNGKWRCYSELFDTEAEAAAWVDGMFTGTSTAIDGSPLEPQAAPARSKAGGSDGM